MPFIGFTYELVYEYFQEHVSVKLESVTPRLPRATALAIYKGEEGGTRWAREGRKGDTQERKVNPKCGRTKRYRANGF